MIRRTIVFVALTTSACNIPSIDTGPAVDLGIADYPPKTNEANAAKHAWSAKLNPSSYRVAYALAPSERAAVEDAFQSWARSVRYTAAGNGAYRWMPPPGCAGDMHCAYANIAQRGAPDLVPLVARFAARQKAANLSTADLTTLIVSFVQNIHYEVPNDMPFGVLPPELVVSEQRGDCDSKSLLGQVLLRSFGVDSVLISSTAHKHTMLGIALPSSGTKVTYAGRQYAFTEMTAKNSPIGHINSSLLSPNDWKVVPNTWH
jgi:hypothetical protein